MCKHISLLLKVSVHKLLHFSVAKTDSYLHKHNYLISTTKKRLELKIIFDLKTEKALYSQVKKGKLEKLEYYPIFFLNINLNNVYRKL